MVRMISGFKNDVEAFAAKSIEDGSLSEKGFLKIPGREDFAISMDNAAPESEPGYQIVGSTNIHGHHINTFQKF